MVCVCGVCVTVCGVCVWCVCKRLCVCVCVCVCMCVGVQHVCLYKYVCADVHVYLSTDY